jgi:hypothetical protein
MIRWYLVVGQENEILPGGGGMYWPPFMAKEEGFASLITLI